jgi:ribosomal protein S18 acetylase RimI-like enzyme
VTEPVLWAARDVPSDELLERVAAVRGELLRRGEFLPPGWTDEAVEDLKAGRLTGWVLRERDGPPGIGFVSRRPLRAYGHVQVDPGADGVGRTVRLLDEAVRSLPPTLARADVGLTGLTPPEEERLVAQYSAPPERTFLTRLSMERPVTVESEGPPPEMPGPLVPWPIRSVPIDSLHALDWAAFRGTSDATLVADTPEENRDMLAELLQGRLGLFLDGASTALADREQRLVGAILVAQQTSSRAIVLDLMVDPMGRRQGVATYLVRWSARALQALGYESMGLWVTETNEPARRLYDRLGFERKLTALIFRLAR